MREVVVNILTNNRVTELCLTLSSLLYQTFKEWDLVLIDDFSQQPCTEYKFFNDIIGRLKSMGHGVRIVRHDFPWLNIGKARNHAVELSRELPKNSAKYIVRVDDDSYCAPDYLERLYDTIRIREDCGAVGGVVPVFAGPDYYRRMPSGEVFNRIIFDEEGNITVLSDDGGYDYEKVNKPVPSHHLRSSFIFRRKAHDEIGGHPLEYGNTGYREETDLSLRLRWAGYKLLTDVNAVCYHQIARMGGARLNPQDYSMMANLNDEHFRKKMKYYFNTKGGEPKV